ncbi:hypothetical protein HYALB_00001031 [Hymenoscyphus albidus]|uniref:Uncharacterized protein n=1 Tax=Hymenoscyphus albidus TaxID=595503 RepID=A0A9N9M134_9HELO|nr:hypothetical protein HYALB_00001031 [Hymenoscyphus albidus]
MPILRNPFARRTEVQTGSLAPEDGEGPLSPTGTRPAFEKVDTMGSYTSASTQSIASKRSQEPVEYKMSVVNDSGVYLPPSPPDKKSFWPRRSSANSRNNSQSEIEHFPISRESFDSYRRSFDISAKSPVVQPSHFGRQSLDSARIPRLPQRRFERQPPTAEEFEDVGLNDEQKQPKKKGFFAKFGDSDPQSPTTTSRFHITGRKRGQSGTGEELGNMPRPSTADSISKDIKITEEG